MNQKLPTFWKHVITVLSGALGAQALPLLLSPLITRMCTPAEMGAFSVWFGIIAVMAIASTLRLETAMVLDHDEHHQRTCFSVIAYSATALAAAVTVCAVAAHAADLAFIRQLSWLPILTLGLGAWLTGTMQATMAYATSHNAFGKAARAKVLGASTIALSQVGLLYAGAGGSALMAGHLAGLAAGLFAARALLSPPAARTGWQLDQEQRAYLQRHQALWRFSLPSNLLNVLCSQLPLFLIGARHGVMAAGLFALTQRVLGAPISLLASSVLEVFKRQSVQDFKTIGNCKQTYRYTFKALLLLGLGPSVVLFLFSPSLFAWLFGEPWRPAGELARILAPLYFLNFIASPLSYVFHVAGKQKIELIWQVVLISMTATVFLMPGTIQESVLRYTIGYSLLYFVYLHMSYQCSQNRLEAA